MDHIQLEYIIPFQWKSQEVSPKKTSFLKESISVKINVRYVDASFRTARGTVVVEGERIAALLPFDGGKEDDGLLCLPGFIDIHTHGGAGADCCGKTPEALQTLSRYYASHGVTSWCPTTMTLPHDELCEVFRAVEAVRDSEDGASIRGVNLEGPYVSRAKCGAQNPAYLRPADPDEVRALHAISPIRLVDAAPEVEGALALPRALGGEIVCSVAHTNATYAETRAAFDAGYTHVTHLFNAMSPFTHRAPGAVGAVFENARVTAELICDGFHLDPVAVRLAFRLLGANRCVAVSDSLPCAGCPDGDGYALGGQQVAVKDGRAFLKDGTIAGSTTNLFQGFRNLLRFGVPFADALAACTINPARVIGADKDAGSIEEGKRADLIFVDDSMNLKHVMVKGKMIF